MLEENHDLQDRRAVVRVQGSRTRREFLAAACSAALGVIGAPALALPKRATYDVVIRHGNVFDGSGLPAREMDIAIVGGRIASVRPRIAGAGRVEIDARGFAVAPGFIDIHLTQMARCSSIPSPNRLFGRGSRPYCGAGWLIARSCSSGRFAVHKSSAGAG
jgi:N-acyl-D-aspartate/D-glutamate deacylase